MRGIPGCLGGIDCRSSGVTSSRRAPGRPISSSDCAVDRDEQSLLIEDVDVGSPQFAGEMVAVVVAADPVATEPRDEPGDHPPHERQDGAEIPFVVDKVSREQKQVGGPAMDLGQ